MSAARQGWRFLVVALAGLGLDIGVATALAAAGVDLRAAAAGGFGVGLAATYAAHSRWTFRDAAAPRAAATAPRYLLATAAALAVRVLAVDALAPLIALFAVPAAAVLLLAAGASFVVSFVLMRHVVFRAVDGAAVRRWAPYALAFAVVATAWRAGLWLGLDDALDALRPMVNMVSRPDDFSERLMLGSLERDLPLGGFMRAFEQDVHIALVRAIDGPGVVRDAYPYVSNYNLQYVVAQAFTLGGALPAKLAYWLAVGLAIAGMAVVVGHYAAFAATEFGDRAAWAACAAFCLSPLTLERAASSYWMIFLCFAPMALSLRFYPQARGPAGMAALGAAVAAALFVKALTGYEYVSTVALGAALPIVYYELRDAGGRPTAAAVARIVARGLAVGLAALVGVAAAAALHVLKAGAFFGDLDKGLQALLLPFAYSTLGSETGIRGDVSLDPLRVLQRQAVTFVGYNLPVNAALAAGLALGLLRARRAGPLAPRVVALAAMTALGAVAAVSWNVLALRHGLVHPHINWVTLTITATPFAAMLCAALLAPRGRVGPDGNRPGRGAAAAA